MDFDNGWYSFIAGLPQPEGRPLALEGWVKAEEQNKKKRWNAKEKKQAKISLESK